MGGPSWGELKSPLGLLPERKLKNLLYICVRAGLAAVILEGKCRFRPGAPAVSIILISPGTGGPRPTGGFRPNGRVRGAVFSSPDFPGGRLSSPLFRPPGWFGSCYFRRKVPFSPGSPGCFNNPDFARNRGPTPSGRLSVQWLYLGAVFSTGDGRVVSKKYSDNYKYKLIIHCISVL